MKLAVISDIHGNLAALDAVLEDIGHERVDAILNLGDALSGPLDGPEVAARLMDIGTINVRGNHDRHILEGREKDWHVDAQVRAGLTSEQTAWLATHPATLLHEGVVLLTHGTPQSDSIGWMDEAASRRPRDFIEAQAEGVDAEVLLCGHTHVSRLMRVRGDRLLVNPGSVGLPFDIGAPDPRYAIIEKRRLGWHASLKSVHYDREAQARRADEMGLPVWAEAYREGWVLPKGL